MTRPLTEITMASTRHCLLIQGAFFKSLAPALMFSSVGFLASTLTPPPSIHRSPSALGLALEEGWFPEQRQHADSGVYRVLSKALYTESESAEIVSGCQELQKLGPMGRD